MFLILVIFVFNGIFSYRKAEYWKWIIYSYFLSITVSFLGAGGGTYSKPAGDGIITYLVRQPTNDVYVLLVGIPAIIISWGGFILFARKAMKVSKRIKAGEIFIQNVGLPRKILEFILLATFLISNQVLSIKNPMNPEVVLGALGYKIHHQALSSSSSIEEELKAGVTTLSKDLPQRIDDETQLDRVTVDARMTSYFYTLSIDASKVESTKDFLVSSFIKNQCANPEERKLIADHGVSYFHSYQLIDETPVAQVLVDDKFCKDAGF